VSEKIDASKPIEKEKALQLDAKLCELFDYHGIHYTRAERREPHLKRIFYSEISIAIAQK